MANIEFERLKMFEDERKKKGSTYQLNDFCNRLVFKAIITSIAMAWLPQATGSLIFTGFASLIFNKSGSVLSVNISTIILASVQIVGGLVSTQFGDTFGRKTTMLISLFGSVFGLSTFSVYMYFQHYGCYDVTNYLWLPVVSSSFVIFIGSAGITALASTCVVENFPPKVSELF